MKRSIFAFIAGLLAWVLVVSLIDRVLRAGIGGYAAAEPKLMFTLGMMAARLIMAAVTSLIAGAVVGMVAPAGKRVAWVLGAVLVAAFIPVHVRVWSALPVWYHLTFLLTLAPLLAFGARLAAATSKGTRPAPSPASP